jgi:hypothetical protein
LQYLLLDLSIKAKVHSPGSHPHEMFRVGWREEGRRKEEGGGEDTGERIEEGRGKGPEWILTIVCIVNEHLFQGCINAVHGD